MLPSMTGCLMWNRLGSSAEIAASAIGSSGTERGTLSWEAVKYGNGTRNTTTGESVDFTANIYNVQSGSMEVWFKPASNSGTQSIVPMFFSAASSTMYGMWWSSGSWYGGSAQTTLATFADSWSAGDVNHFAMTWDLSGIDGGSDIWRIYKNGVDSASSTGALAPGNYPTNRSIRLGRWYNNDSRWSDASFDNIKVWSQAKIDFYDRFYEGFSFEKPRRT